MTAENLAKALPQGVKYQCPKCSFGPILHTNCENLRSHHGESNSKSVVNNSCPNCNFLGGNINEWKKWDGKMFKNTDGGDNNVVKDKLKKNYMDQTGR